MLIDNILGLRLKLRSWSYSDCCLIKELTKALPSLEEGQSIKEPQTNRIIIVPGGRGGSDHTSLIHTLPVVFFFYSLTLKMCYIYFKGDHISLSQRLKPVRFVVKVSGNKEKYLQQNSP